MHNTPVNLKRTVDLFFWGKLLVSSFSAYLTAICLWMPLCGSVVLANESPETVNTTELVRLAVTDDLQHSLFKDLIQDTLNSLERNLSSRYKIEVYQTTPEALKEDITRHRVDAFIAPSTLYRQSLLSGAKDIAVILPRDGLNPNASEGATLLVKMGEAGFPSLFNWAKLKISFAGSLTSTSLLSLNDELQNIYHVKADNLEQLRDQAELDLKKGIERLESNETDILVLPVCALENYAKTASVPANLALINAKENSSLPCLHSTNLYQGITFAAMPSLSVQAFNLLSTEILSITHSAGKWAIATDFSRLDRALERLEKDAWAALREPSWQAFLKKYRLWFVGALIIAAAAALNILLLGILVKRRTMALTKSMAEQERLRTIAARSREKLDKLQRLTTIGQMASLFAHELRQPLNALSCYAYGLKRAREKENLPPNRMIDEGLSGLTQQITRANAIVEKVRNYVKSQTCRETPLNFLDVVRNAISNFQTTSAGNIPIKLKTAQETLPHNEYATALDSVRVAGDPMELELIVVNLLRNAAEAQEKSNSPEIRVIIKTDNSYITLTVEDNGPPLSEEKFLNIITLGESTRPEGLGLGLSIVKDLVYAHQGDIRFTLSKDNNLIVTIQLPLYKEDSNERE